MRPSAILDVIRSGEDIAKLVPEEVTASIHCQSQKFPLSRADDEEENMNGCGSMNGRASGAEMIEMEKKLRDDENASSREIEILSPSQFDGHLSHHGESKFQSLPIKKTHRINSRQILGKCKNCGYMSSQDICKACSLLEGLNRNRPKIEVEIDAEDNDGSKPRRLTEGLALAVG